MVLLSITKIGNLQIYFATDEFVSSPESFRQFSISSGNLETTGSS